MAKQQTQWCVLCTWGKSKDRVCLNYYCIKYALESYEWSEPGHISWLWFSDSLLLCMSKLSTSLMFHMCFDDFSSIISCLSYLTICFGQLEPKRWKILSPILAEAWLALVKNNSTWGLIMIEHQPAFVTSNTNFDAIAGMSFTKNAEYL